LFALLDIFSGEAPNSFMDTTKALLEAAFVGRALLSGLLNINKMYTIWKEGRKEGCITAVVPIRN
jgi:hypothetical protein